MNMELVVLRAPPRGSSAHLFHAKDAKKKEGAKKGKVGARRDAERPRVTHSPREARKTFSSPRLCANQSPRLRRKGEGVSAQPQ
jgi:hypothetical protein